MHQYPNLTYLPLGDLDSQETELKCNGVNTMELNTLIGLETQQLDSLSGVEMDCAQINKNLAISQVHNIMLTFFSL